MSQFYVPSAPTAVGAVSQNEGPEYMPQLNYPQGVGFNQRYEPLQIQPGQQIPVQGLSLASHLWGKTPQMTVCHFCRNNGYTYIKYESGLLTWACCATIACFGCYAGCCLIPFCVNDCKDSYHYCQTCHCLLGVNKYLR